MKRSLVITKALLVLLALGTYPQLAEAQLPCKDFAAVQDLGKLGSVFLDEISGLALSRKNPNLLWAHNDSGATAKLYLLTRQARLVAEYEINGVVAKDWEDIAVGPCAKASEQSCVYIGDVGNNSFKRTDLNIIVVQEPDLPNETQTIEEITKLDPLQIIRFKYPEVDESTAPALKCPDAESLMVHPQTAQIYVVSKQTSGGISTLYEIEHPQNDEEITAKDLASYTFNSLPLIGSTTGADFSPLGTHFAVRTYFNAYEFDLSKGETPAQAFTKPSMRFAIAEKQGEALAYSADGKSLLSISEGIGEALHYYACIAGDPDPVDPDPVDPDPDPVDPDPDPVDPDPVDPDPDPVDPNPDPVDPDPVDPNPDPVDPGTPTEQPHASNNASGCTCQVSALSTHSTAGATWLFLALVALIVLRRRAECKDRAQ